MLGIRPSADLVILSTRGLYPLWLRIAVISAHVEVFAVEAKLSGKNRR